MTMPTKDRLLDVAEELFAEKGYAETSLRDITSAADANLASVNYHFGSKEALLEAVFARRLGPVNRERLELLRALDRQSGGEPLPLEQVLWAFLAPPFRKMTEWGRAGRRFMQLIGRMHVDPGSAIESFLKQFERVKAEFQPRFAQALPHLSEQELARRVHFVIGSMAHTFTWCSAIGELHPEQTEHDVVLGSLVSFAAQGMRAPAGDVVDPLAAVVTVATSGPDR